MSRSRTGRTPDWLTLDTDERVRLRAHPSKNLLLAAFAVGTGLLLGVGALALLFEVAAGAAQALSAAVLTFVFLLTGAVHLLTRRLEYAVTTRRVCRAVGLGSKRVETVPLDQVTGVTVEQSGWQRRLDVGEVRVHRDGGDGVRFRYVEHPQWTREQLLDSLEGRR